MTHTPSAPWLSLHVFLSDAGATERYLSERLAPAIAHWRAQQMLDRWFFIRYWEGGPHLRVRLAGPIAHEEQQAIALLSDGIDQYRSPQPLSRDAYYREHTFDGLPVALEDLPWYPDGSVVKIAYEPELVRYGGRHAIDSSEQLFELSSRLALSVGAAARGQQNARLSSAFAFMAAAILACDPSMDALRNYYARYCAVWASHVSGQVREAAAPQVSEDQLALLARLQQEAAAGWGGKSAHAVWAGAIAQFAARLSALHTAGQLVMPVTGEPTVGADMAKHAVLGIVGSQIHMLNNRLGIPAAGEFLLARLLVGAANTVNQPGAMI